METIRFEKTYTRDNCFIIQEIWDAAYSQDYSGNTNPYLPFKVNYLKDGAIEFWENLRATEWLDDSILKKNMDDAKFFEKIAEEHRKIAMDIRKMTEHGRLDTVEDLQRFLELVERGTYTFLFFYHSAMNDSTPEDIRSTALRLRDEDAFYDDADRIIRSTIEYLYPHTAGLTISMLRDELPNPPDRSTRLSRFDHCIMMIDGTLELIDLNEFDRRRKDFEFLIEEQSEADIVRGNTAVPGFVRGIVRILRRKDQVEELREGEVLVSPMTTPDYVPAMKKSSAIVTDEGGITCHAAIVARELKKPCITSTKFATQLFHDGDMVEVDAENGIVKLIKPSK